MQVSRKGLVGGLVGGALAGALGVAAAAWAHGGADEHRGGHGMGGMQMGMHGAGMQGGGMHGMGMGRMGGGMSGGMGSGMGMPGNAANLDTLKDALKLTAEQQPAWEKYAEVVRRRSEARDKMRSAMHNGTVEHGAMHETMAAFQREAAKEIGQAREQLSAVLNAEQRQVLDSRGSGRGHGRGGSMARGGEHRH